MSALLSNNWSYHAVPALFCLPLVPSYRGALMRLGVDNNANPRIVLDQLEKSGKYPPKVINKIRKLQACEANLWEGLSVILAAIVAGNSAGLSAKFMNGVSLGYLLVRIAYIQVYTKTESKKASYIRSLLWWTGNAISFVTFVKAGNALNNKP